MNVPGKELRISDALSRVPCLCENNYLEPEIDEYVAAIESGWPMSNERINTRNRSVERKTPPRVTDSSRIRLMNN